MFEVGNKICGTAESNKHYGITNASMLLAEITEITTDNTMQVKILAHIDSSKVGSVFTVTDDENLFSIVPEEIEKEILASIAKEHENVGWKQDSGFSFSQDIIEKVRDNSIYVNGGFISRSVVMDMMVPLHLIQKVGINIDTLHTIPCMDDDVEGQAVALIGQVSSFTTDTKIVKIIEDSSNPAVKEKLIEILSNDASPWKQVEELKDFGAIIFQNTTFEYEGETFDFSNQILIISDIVNDQLMIKFMPLWYQIYGYEWSDELNSSIEEYNRDGYVKTLNGLYNSIIEEERKRVRKEMFDKFSKDFPMIQRRGIENTLSGIEENIQMFREKLVNALKDEERYRMQLFYLINGRPSEAIQEFKEYIETLGDRLKSVRVDGDYLIMCLEHPLSFYDEELWEVLRDNEDSIIYDCQSWITSLMHDIFEHGKYELTFEQRFTVNLSSKYVEATRDFEYFDRKEGEGTTGIPNPHLYYYNCWGDYESIIRSLIEKYDLVMMTSQIQASIGSLNLSDNPVMERFIEDELTNDIFQNIPCLINKESGERISIKQYRENNNIEKQVSAFYQKYHDLYTVQTPTEDQISQAKTAICEYESLNKIAKKELENDYMQIKRLIEE